MWPVTTVWDRAGGEHELVHPESDLTQGIVEGSSLYYSLTQLDPGQGTANILLEGKTTQWEARGKW